MDSANGKQSHRSPLLPQTWSDNTRVTVTVGFFILIIGGVFGTGSYVANLQNTVSANQVDITELQKAKEKSDEQALANQLRLTEIQTQLKSIDVTLSEIKQKL